MKIKRNDLYIALKDLVGIQKAEQLIEDLRIVKKEICVIHFDEVLRRGWDSTLMCFYLGNGRFFDADFVEKVENYLIRVDINFKGNTESKVRLNKFFTENSQGRSLVDEVIEERRGK